MPKTVPMRLLKTGAPEEWRCGECGHDFTVVRNSKPELNLYEIPALKVKVPRCPSCSSIWDRAPGWERSPVVPPKVRMQKVDYSPEGPETLETETWECSCGTRFSVDTEGKNNAFSHDDGHTVPRCPTCRRVWDENLQGFKVP